MVHIQIGRWCAALLLAAAALPAAELAPYIPALKPLPGMSFIQPEEVAATFRERVVRPTESRTVRSLDGMWKFSGLVCSDRPFGLEADLDQGFDRESFDDSKWESIKVPLNWYNDPRYSYQKFYREKEPFVKGWYRRTFELAPEELDLHRIRLNFGVIGYSGKLYVNGRAAGASHGDFVPVSFDITDFVKPGRNTIALRVDSDFGPPPGSDIKITRTYGAKWWYENVKGGLWQPVSLSIEPQIRFEALRVTPLLSEQSIRIDYEIENHFSAVKRLSLECAVTDALREKANMVNSTAEFGALNLKPGLNSGSLVMKLDSPVLWSPERPQLYFLTAVLNDSQREGEVVAAECVRFGVRDFRTAGTGFELNGRPVYLFGENIHSTKYGGYDRTPAEERRLIEEYIGALKRQGYVMLRTAHMPAIPLVYEVADELGMMIYDEWSWSFTSSNIDEAQFESNNLDELRRFIRRDYNHPSVVMWSLANEVKHASNPVTQRQLSRQVELVRSLDVQKRPVGVFSGSANWDHYGRTKFDTDFLDLHSYHGLVDLPWPAFARHIDHIYRGCAEIYGDGKTLAIPLIAWEFVGYSWGNRLDASFRMGDVDAYAKYATKKFSWGQPEGIGYSGAVGLAPLLDPERGLPYAMDRQGGRLLELVRQEPRIQGFAPWFSVTNLTQPPRWTQKVYGGLRLAGSLLPPRNVFADTEYNWEFYMVNNSSENLRAGKVRFSLVDSAGKSWTLDTVPTAPLAVGRLFSIPVELEIPRRVTPGEAQLRITLFDADRNEIGRNYANVSVESREILTEPLKPGRRVALLDVGNGDTVLEKILETLEIPFRKLPLSADPDGCEVVLIPPDSRATGKLVYDQEKFSRWLEKGGILVVFEQHSGTLPVFDNYQYANDPNAYVDLVLPDHPLFAGMRQSQFDLWPEAPEGNVITTAISPYSVNALAVKGPFLYRMSIGTGIFEATAGRGRVLASQLDATSLWGRDSGASRYVRNLLEYVVNKPQVRTARPAAVTAAPLYRMNESRAVFVDLGPYANRSFSDEKDGDGEGGWLDQGRNDFREMPLGRITAAGIPFHVIDPAKNENRGCLVLRGSARPSFPAAIRGIKVGERISRLFFLHTSGWSNDAEAGRYVIHYADGTQAEFLLQGGRNIGDWWQCRQLPEAKVGFTRKNAVGGEVGFFVAEWNNPKPEVQIESIDFLSAIRGDAGGVDWVKSEAAVPVLAAITGERVGAGMYMLYSGTETPPKKWWGMAWRGGDAPSFREVETLPGAPAPRALEVKLPAGRDGGVPVVSTPVEPAKLPAEAGTLSFWIRVETPGVIDLVLPSKDWKSLRMATLTLEKKGGAWQRIALDLSKDFQFTGPAFPLSEMRGEFYLYNGMNQQRSYPRPATAFEITRIAID